jgi:membrane protein YdbS with pleckstrin-like domain
VPFPPKLLNDGEDLVLDLRPHWWYLAGPTSLLVLALVLLVIAGAADLPDVLVWALAGVVVGSLLWFAGRYARWATTNFVVTSDRIVYRHGVVAKRAIEIPLDRVNTIFSSQSIFERVLRSGDLTIESGGELGHETFTDIPRPAAVQQEIYRQIEVDQSRRGGGGAVDPLEQLDRLDDLRRRGVISEAEFEAKKAQLLDRM